MTEMSSLGPSASEAYAKAWDVLKRCFLELLLLAVVWALLSAPAGWFRDSLLGPAYQVLVLGPAGFGGMYAFLRAVRGGKPEVADVFVAFRDNYVQAVLASLLMGVLISIGFVLLVIPGFIAIVRLAWVPYLVTDEHLDAVAAVRESWERTRGHGWAIFGLFLLAIPILLIGVVLLVVGVIPALMWVQLASAVLYADVTARSRTQGDGPLAPAQP